MRKVYYKDGAIVPRPKQLTYNGSTYVPPSDEVLIAAGYTIKQIEDRSLSNQRMTKGIVHA